MLRLEQTKTSPSLKSKYSLSCFYVKTNVNIYNLGAITDHPKVDALFVTCLALLSGKFYTWGSIIRGLGTITDDPKVDALFVTCLALLSGKFYTWGSIIRGLGAITDHPKVDALFVTCLALLFRNFYTWGNIRRGKIHYPFSWKKNYLLHGFWYFPYYIKGLKIWCMDYSSIHL